MNQPELSSVNQHRKPLAQTADSQRMVRPVVIACDESYAMPLATALRSIVDASRSEEPLDVYVLSDYFSEAMQQKIIDSLPPGSALIHWVAVDLIAFKEFSTISYISKVTFARFMLPQIFAEGVSRVLYLDADVLVLDDLEPLWDMDLKGAVIGAVLDNLDVHSKACDPGYEDVPRVRHYFNAGVLLIDLDRWRKECVSENAMEYLRCHPHTPYADQDALNVACDGHWTALDPRWNFQQHNRAAILDMVPAQRPKIVHFVTGTKPWKASMMSVNAGLYDTFRSRTQFARTAGDKVRDFGSSAWPRLKSALKRTSFVQVVWTKCRRWSQRVL
jgi:lipopolysaccharide biosynthesis glycosyltransferase